MENKLNNVDLINIIKRYNTITDCALEIYGDKTRNSCNKITRFCNKNNIDYNTILKKKEEKHYYCLNCGKEILGKNKSRKKFCSHSCSATYNNKGKRQSIETRRKRSRTFQEKNPNFDGNYKDINEKVIKKYNNFDPNKEYFCLNCGKRIENPCHSKMNKFCTRKCANEYKGKKILEDWQNGVIKIKSGRLPEPIKEYLLGKVSYKCEMCGFEGYNKLTNKTILQIHHKDGDALNNTKDNLQILCPNCHAMTENFGNCGSRTSSRTRWKSKKYYFEKFKKEYGI